MVVNKSSEARFDWIKPYLREIWTGIFILFSTYYLFNDDKILWSIMKLHADLSGPFGYIIAFFIGGVILVACWWVTGKMFHQSLTTPPKPDAPSVVIQLPPVGNLKQRAIALSDEIMENLCEHGWGPHPSSQQLKKWSGRIFETMPKTEEGITQWTRSRSNYFKFRFVKRVIDLRDEFAQLHIREQDLDSFIALYREHPLHLMEDRYFILPQKIERVAECLIKLAEQIK